MKLIDNWSGLWRKWSVQIAGFIIFLPVAWESVPEELKAVLPEEWKVPAMQVLAVLLIVARAIKQER